MQFSSEHIAIFLAVMDQGSFSAAARSLKRVPSAVSMAIANMEAELGYALFERSSREPQPTEKAKALEPHARMIAEQLKLLQVHAQELSMDLESVLNIGVAADINPDYLLPALSELTQRYPLLNVNVITAAQDDIIEMLHAHKIQLSLVYGGLYVNGDEQFQYLGSESLVATISASHIALAHPSGVFIEDLVNVRQIMIASHTKELRDERSLVATNYWQTDSFQMALGMVEAGMGWGNLPYSLIYTQLQKGKLKQLQFKNTKNELRLPIHAMWLKGESLQKGAKELVELMSTHQPIVPNFD